MVVFFASLASVPRPVFAAVTAGSLVKGSTSAVYYVTGALTRLAFPDEQTYLSWYPDFSTVRMISDTEMSTLPLVALVTVRPGINLVKIVSDPKVYAISRGAVLRWILSEEMAKTIYGEQWGDKIVTVPDELFANYEYGETVSKPGQYYWFVERDAAPDIQTEYRLTLAARAIPSSYVPPVPYIPPQPPPSPTPPPPVTMGTLTIKPSVVNRYAASSKPEDFSFQTGGEAMVGGSRYNFDPGTYYVFAIEKPNYSMSDWGGDCTKDGKVTINKGDNRTCTITATEITSH